VKILEITLHNGVDPMTGKQLGLGAGEVKSFDSFDALFDAWRRQVRHFLDIKLRGNQLIGRMYATMMPAPFLSVLIDDCIANGRDYNAGGARLQQHLCPIRRPRHHNRQPERDQANRVRRPRLGTGRAGRHSGRQLRGPRALRQRFLNKTHKYGNDDDYADDITVRIFNTCFEELDGKPDSRGGRYRIEMLPTTCHVYFGGVTARRPTDAKPGFPCPRASLPFRAPTGAAPRP